MPGVMARRKSSGVRNTSTVLPCWMLTVAK